VRSEPFASLLGGRAAPERIFYYRLWFKGHNNPRYAELLPRLERLDRFLVRISDRRIVRSLEYRAFHATRHLHNPVIARLGSRRYRGMFTVDNELIPHFRGPVVSDVDDPTFSPAEVRLLNSPNVRAYVVTAERAARQFEELGVEKPSHVIPQGFSRAAVRPEVRDAIAARWKSGPVVGYMAAWLLSAGDRDGDGPLYNVDHLLDLWDELHARVPVASLWLVGEPSERVRARLRGRSDVVLFGRLPREEALSTAASFDVALYPRTIDQGIRASKVGEYLGLGLPVVSYDLQVTDELRELGAGELVTSARDFVAAVERLLVDADARELLAGRARAAGALRDWDVLAQEYEQLLDVYLPR
jgi:glycosyltransferase involved in cell wall biosynthesis